MGSDVAPVFLTVDEIEPDQHNHLLATLLTDSGDRVIVPVELLPEGTRVGDVLHAHFSHAPDERERRRSRIADLQRRLFGSG